MLADLAAASHDYTGQWVSVACAIAATVAAIYSARRQPSVDAQFATKAELAAVRTEIASNRAHIDGELERLRGKVDRVGEQLWEKLDDAKLELNRNGEQRAVNIHERLNAIATAVARIDERTKSD